MHGKQTNKNGKEKFMSPYSPDNTGWRKIDTEHQTYSQCNKSAGQTLNTQIPGLGSCVRLTAQGSFCVQTADLQSASSPLHRTPPTLHEGQKLTWDLSQGLESTLSHSVSKAVLNGGKGLLSQELKGREVVCGYSTH